MTWRCIRETLQTESNTDLYFFTVGMVNFDCCNLTLQSEVPDPNMKVVVNEGCSSDRVFLNTGDTVVTVTVWSPDGTNTQVRLNCFMNMYHSSQNVQPGLKHLISWYWFIKGIVDLAGCVYINWWGWHSCLQVYTLTVTRKQLPLAVTFCDVKDQMEFECSVSLNAFYRPLSINPRYTVTTFTAILILFYLNFVHVLRIPNVLCSDPRVVFSAPYIDLLTRRSKVHPFTGEPLRDTWKLLEPELDKQMSNTSVQCFFAHRGMFIITENHCTLYNCKRVF